jgi:hypothetical protein
MDGFDNLMNSSINPEDLARGSGQRIWSEDLDGVSPASVAVARAGARGPNDQPQARQAITRTILRTLG